MMKLSQMEHMRIVLAQIVTLQVKIDITGIEEDNSNLYEPFYQELDKLVIPTINWAIEEEDNIQWRTGSVLE